MVLCHVVLHKLPPIGCGACKEVRFRMHACQSVSQSVSQGQLQLQPMFSLRKIRKSETPSVQHGKQKPISTARAAAAAAAAPRLQLQLQGGWCAPWGCVAPPGAHHQPTHTNHLGVRGTLKG